MTTIDTNIPVFSNPINRDTQTPSEISQAGDDTIAEFPIITNKINTVAGQMNTVAGEVNDYATAAAGSAALSESAATNAIAASNATIYSDASTYTAGQTIIFTDGYAYRCLTATSAGESPTTHPAKWLNITGITALTQDLDCDGNQFNGSSYTQIADASLGTGTHTFDYANGDMQQLTATGDITIAFSNFVSGAVCGMLIDAVNWGAHTLTWPAGVLFAGGAEPEWTEAGIDRVAVIKDKDNVYTISRQQTAIAAVA